MFGLLQHMVKQQAKFSVSRFFITEIKYVLLVGLTDN